jgi:hypothetical protein
VFIGHRTPEDNPDALNEWEQNLFDRAGREGLRRIWPPAADIAWPTEDIPDNRLAEQMMFMQDLAELIALPLTGRRAEEIQQIATEYRAAGEDPRDIRAKWGKLEPGAAR